MSETEEVVVDVEDVGLEEVAALDVEDFDAAVGGGTETKLFGKWSFSDIKVRDISLEVQIAAVSGLYY